MLVADLIEELQQMPPTASVFVQMRTPPVIEKERGEIQRVVYEHGNVEITIGMWPELVGQLEED